MGPPSLNQLHGPFTTKEPNPDPRWVLQNPPKKCAGREWGYFCSILTSLRWIWNNCTAQIWVSRSKVQTQHVPSASNGLANSRCQKQGVKLTKEPPCTIKGIYWGPFINTAPEYSQFVWTPRGAQWGGRWCTVVKAKSLCVLSRSFWNMHEFQIT